jgi:hypothetical protein
MVDHPPHTEASMHPTRALALSTAAVGALLALMSPVQAAVHAPADCYSRNISSKEIFPEGHDIKPYWVPNLGQRPGYKCENGTWREYWP